MKTEKIIKAQARRSLGGNWVQILSGCAVVVALMILFESFMTLLLVVTNNIDINTDEITALGYVMIAICYTALFFVSPIINGVLKTAANIAMYGKSDVRDVFYFFKGSKYLKTIFINFLIMLLFGISSSLLDSYRIASTVLSAELGSASLTDISTIIILVTALIVSIITKLLCFFIFAYYPLSAYALDDSKSVGYYSFKMIGFSFRHLGSAIKLTLSFVGWILLCFFIVPSFYVLPYFMVSMVSSTKWLIMLERSRGKMI